MTSVEPTVTDDTQHVEAEVDEAASQARESQDVLTQSVGQRLTRASRDAQKPRWKRLLGKG